MPYTMETYISEIEARMPRYEASVKSNHGQLEMHINRARRDVQSALLPVAEYRFGRRRILSAAPTLESRLTVQNGSYEIKFYTTPLPADVIDVAALNVLTSAVWRGAQRLTKQELYGVANNTYTRPMPHRPVFAIEKSPGAAVSSLYVSKGTAAVGASEIEIFYTAALAHLEQVNSSDAADAERKIPWDCEELVIYKAMWLMFAGDKFVAARRTLEADMDLTIRILEDNYKNRIDRSHLLLPSRESLVPNVPMPESMAAG